MLNRRNVLKNGFAIPLFHPLHLNSNKNCLEKIADEIERNAIKMLSGKNPVLQSIKTVRIFEDENLRKFGRSSFYGFVKVKLYPINHHFFENCKVDVSSTGYKNILDLINDCRSSEYGFYYDLNYVLDPKDVKKVLDILWKRAGYTGYNGGLLNA